MMLRKLLLISELRAREVELPKELCLQAYRALISIAGLMGAAGVALAARAAHGGGDTNLMLAAFFLMIHASALPSLALLAQSHGARGWFAIVGFLLAAGACLFSGDLAYRFFVGTKLFTNAAPIGGSLLIFGWLVLAYAGFAAAKHRRT